MNPTIISQYANSPVLDALIDFMSQDINPDADIDAFYDYVWNVATAQGFGLDIWGRIVGVGRDLNIPGTVVNFGFSEGAGYYPFDEQPFYNGPPATSVYTLGDEAYRTLILVKALSNISNVTASSLNNLLQVLFAGRGRCYVVDTGAMQIRYVFEFILQPYEQSIFTNSNAIARPAGVGASLLIVDVPGTFGFAEATGSQPFNQGVFFDPSRGIFPTA